MAGQITPPDVEPVPPGTAEALLRWLASSHIAACDRGAASKGVQLGDWLADLVTATARLLQRALPREAPSKETPRRTATATNLPRLRRSPFYRRARALQFKRSYER